MAESKQFEYNPLIVDILELKKMVPGSPQKQEMLTRVIDAFDSLDKPNLEDNLRAFGFLWNGALRDVVGNEINDYDDVLGEDLSSKINVEDILQMIDVIFGVPPISGMDVDQCDFGSSPCSKANS